jgi:hypothetical protein
MAAQEKSPAPQCNADAGSVMELAWWQSPAPNLTQTA